MREDMPYQTLSPKQAATIDHKPGRLTAKAPLRSDDVFKTAELILQEDGEFSMCVGTKTLSRYVKQNLTELERWHIHSQWGILSHVSQENTQTGGSPGNVSKIYKP